MRRILHQLVILMFLSQAFASSERLISIDSISVKSDKFNFSVSAQGDKESNLIRLELTSGEREVAVPATEFIGVSKVQIGSMTISTASSLADIPTPVGKIIVTFKCGEFFYHSKDGADLLVSSLVRFVFIDNKYVRREMIVPVDGDDNSWKSFEKAPGEQEVLIGDLKQADYPYITK